MNLMDIFPRMSIFFVFRKVLYPLDVNKYLFTKFKRFFTSNSSVSQQIEFLPSCCRFLFFQVNKFESPLMIITIKELSTVLETSSSHHY